MILKKINNKHIEEYLQNNSDFFIKNPALLDKLEFPSASKEKTSKIVSFKDWIIGNLKNKQKDFIETAKHNYITQTKVHESIIHLLRQKNIKDFFNFLNTDLTKLFEVEIISLVTSEKKFSEKYGQIFLNEKKINLIHRNDKNLILDATDESYNLYDNLEVKIYSNAIFSIDKFILGSPALLVFGSKTNHFIGKKAYDLIRFFSLVFENKFNSFVNE
ncbi:MAG: hypothetical protein CMM89_06955 [Rickettsiales bacterium]|nr:hypothetical protein [Rickettsiales bacterium]OUT43342.1 MAG: hypothetical protein CBB73_06810 [Pelagibacteraceae bacterium TMED13]|tara:strand:- start:280 stop:930 length:651 start_codon:yes stop_codon:yes gene_type:complete